MYSFQNTVWIFLFQNLCEDESNGIYTSDCDGRCVLKSLIGDGYCDSGFSLSNGFENTPFDSFAINLNCNSPWIKYDGGDCEALQVFSKEPIKEFQQSCPPDFIEMTSDSIGNSVTNQ